MGVTFTKINNILVTKQVSYRILVPQGPFEWIKLYFEPEKRPAWAFCRALLEMH